jgi:hypothetical protein
LVAVSCHVEPKARERLEVILAFVARTAYLRDLDADQRAS